ncbi:MAG: helix-turn-helix transcriptional regulator [Gallionella sp.]|nr:helix-turn-helix transcriptional regulator [Gallionella sp.]
MKSQAASLKPTKTLESLSTKVFDVQPTSTAPCRVIFAEFPVPAKPPLLPGAIDIDDLVAEFEQTSDAAEAIAKGRQWVAKSFYSNQPSSIALLRLQKGWSQAELAKRASTSQSYIARLELGNVDPQVSTVKKLAKALDVPVGTVVLAISPEDEK